MTQEVKLRRAQCNYQSENARFLLECDFSKKYSKYYSKRLQRTRPFLELNCRSKWGHSIPLYNLTELATGALFCDADRCQQLLQSPSNNSTSASFMFTKKMRRTSENQSPAPRTSTQIQDTEVGLFTTPELHNRQQTPPILSPILDVPTRNSAPIDCIIMGTIFKRMKMKSDVIQSLAEGDFFTKCDRFLGHFTSQQDRLVLEDFDESIPLTGSINPEKFVTGILVALLGYVLDDGQFFVRDICYAEPNRRILYDETVDIPRAPINLQDEPIYLLVISGLGFHQDMGKTSVLTKALQNLIDFVWGGSSYSDDQRSSRVARVLVVGDSLHENRLYTNEELPSQRVELSLKVKQSRQVKEYTKSIQAVKHMDDFFAQLSKTIHVDVMPGPTDPSSHLMPQQPFHPCMFPKSSLFQTFNCVTNPHHAIYNDNVEILASSSQNIDIISKFSGLNDPIEIMKCHLMWGDSAPGAPSHLYSVPYEEDDPFVIDFIPEIYIVGCQEAYRTDYYNYSLYQDPESCSVKGGHPTNGEESHPQNCNENPSSQNDDSSQHATIKNNEHPVSSARKIRTLLVTVPKFHKTFSCVMINLRTLESHSLSFI